MVKNKFNSDSASTMSPCKYYVADGIQLAWLTPKRKHLTVSNAERFP